MGCKMRSNHFLQKTELFFMNPVSHAQRKCKNIGRIFFYGKTFETELPKLSANRILYDSLGNGH